MMRLRAIVPTLALLIVTATSAAAQFGPGPRGQAPFDRQQGPRNEAGRFDYYALVLSWSPTHCATNSRGPQDTQCAPRSGRGYSFVLHGLWPQHERGYPDTCPTRERPFVPRPTIDRMLDIMPSVPLIIHEYRKHGTCSGLQPDGYFNLARRLFDKVRIPPRYERPNQPFFVTPGEVVHDFVSVNPQLKPDMLAVVCGGPGGRLREIRVCFSREGEFKACGQNENARRLCSLPRMYVPPVRNSGDRQPAGPQRGLPQQAPLPGPGEAPRTPGDRRI